MKKLLNPLLLTLILLTSTLYATPDCTKSLKTQDFVQRFYAVILGREADNAGMDDWTNQLLSRSATGATIAQGFIFSAEYNIDSKSNTQYLNDLYAAFFNRPADTDGFNYWMNEIANGSNRNKVLYGFLHSAEFINLSNSYGIQAYEGAAFESTEITNFVQRFYSVILGRTADSGGLAHWTNKLSTGESTGSDIAKGFIFSVEYNIDSKSNTQYLNDLYSAFFNRPADTDGFNFWMNKIASGSSREDVLDGFLGSQEFINLTNAYGILAFTGAPQSTSNNTAPTANAGSDQSAFLGQTLNLSGSASSDSDGTLSCYWWKEGSTLLATTENFSKSDFEAKEHNIILTVVDNKGVSASTSVRVTILSGYQKPMANNQNIVFNIRNTDYKLDLEGQSVYNLSHYIIKQNPQHGTLIGTAPYLKYVPNDGYIGSDSFRYIIRDVYALNPDDLHLDSEIIDVNISVLVFNTLKNTYQTNETVGVYVEAALSGDQDWVGVFPVGADNAWENVIAWNWVTQNGNTQLNLNPKAMPAGEYEVRLFYHNASGVNAKAKATYRFTMEDVPQVVYGQAGTHPTAYHDEVDVNMTRVYYPTDIPVGEKVPVVFFASGYGSNDATDYESLLRFVASHGYYVIYAKHAWDNVFANMDKMLDNVNGILPKIDTTRIGVMGHSLGGGYTFNILKHFSDMGYGNNGRFVMVLEGYYAYNLTENEMKNLPSNTNVVMQQYGVGGNNAVNNTDPRITLTEYYMLDSIPANQKDWQIVENADHHYPYGNKAYAQMQGILKPLDALMEYTFKGTPSAQMVALEQGSDDPYHQGNGIQVVNARSDYGTKCDYDTNVAIDYCDMAQWYYKKQLILHQKGHWLPSMAGNFSSRAAYINSLPFSGFTMVGNSYTNRVMEVNATLLSYSYIWNEVKNVKDLYPTKSNFLVVDMHFPADFWDDAVWNNVIANFQTLAKVANDLGFRGIIYDDEAYDVESHKMINYKHGNVWYDDDAYKNPNYTFAEHSAKITARFKQIMQAMVTEYPAIDVLYYHSPVEGHIEADNGIEGHPVVVNVGLERQHEWIGAMFLGFKQGLSHQATLHDMGEDYRLRTQKHFDDTYTWRKHTIASDASNDAVDATAHWIVPVADRADWAEKVHVNFMVSNEPLASATYPEFDTTNSVGLNDMKMTLERSLDKSDKYVSFYCASSSDNQRGRIQLDWLNDPATHADDGSAYGLDVAWKSMVEEVYSTKVLK